MDAKTIKVYVSANDLAVITTAANTDGVSISQFVRMASIEKASAKTGRVIDRQPEPAPRPAPRPAKPLAKNAYVGFRVWHNELRRYGFVIERHERSKFVWVREEDPLPPTDVPVFWAIRDLLPCSQKKTVHPLLGERVYHVRKDIAGELVEKHYKFDKPANHGIWVVREKGTKSDAPLALWNELEMEIVVGVTQDNKFKTEPFPRTPVPVKRGRGRPRVNSVAMPPAPTSPNVTPEIPPAVGPMPVPPTPPVMVGSAPEAVSLPVIDEIIPDDSWIRAGRNRNGASGSDEVRGAAISR